MRMIFYYPWPIQENGTSADTIRPYKMLSAFKKIGIEVYEVTGYAKERKEKIQNVKKQVQKGVKIDFTYGENTLLPFLFNEKSRYPTHPLMDYMFFRWLKDQQIPFGLFYRDIHWRFPEFRKNLPFTNGRFRCRSIIWILKYFAKWRHACSCLRRKCLSFYLGTGT